MAWHEIITSIATAVVVVLGAIGAFYKIFVEKRKGERKYDLSLAKQQAELLVKPLSEQIDRNNKKIEDLEGTIKQLKEEVEEKTQYVYAWELSSSYIHSIIIWLSDKLPDAKDFPPMPRDLKSIFARLSTHNIEEI